MYSKGSIIQWFTGIYGRLMSIGYNRPSFNRKDQQRYCRIHYNPILNWITYLTEPIVLTLNVCCIFVLNIFVLAIRQKIKDTINI